MAVSIRLARAGSKKSPFYRVVVTDSRSPRGGRFLEAIGHFDPLQKDAGIFIKSDRLSYWKGVGAQPSETVASLLKRAAAPKA